ncbi:MAG TPA: (2Fe-2S)-binding protein [Candidatus Limnocylindrales bacterium]|nr:(2Fe-2S)-binding protein [Candidatus Limnocylindrales bacterium]
MIHLTVNGVPHALEVPGALTLLDLLRDRLGLTGTKECCAVGECGACTVLLDDRSVTSCLVLAAEADAKAIVTIEGLAPEGGVTALQAAFLATGAVQCGFCIPGQVMAAHYLLRRRPQPSPDEVREALSGNLCRCGGYEQICEAVLAAARATRA